MRPFQLDQTPLIRFQLLRLAPNKHLFLSDMHHIIADGVSFNIIVKEFVALYHGDVLSPLRIQCKDFALWQVDLFSSEILKSQEDYWLKHLAGLQPFVLPTDFSSQDLQDFEGQRVIFALSIEETATLKQIATDMQGTLYMLLLAVYCVLLSFLAHQDDIAVGSSIAGRNHPDSEDLVGMFVNTLVMRVQVVQDQTFKTFWSR